MSYHFLYHLSGSARDCRLLHNDSTTFGMLYNICSNGLERCHVCCTACTRAAHLGWCIHRNYDNVGFADTFRYVRREKQIGCPKGVDTWDL